MKGFKFFINFYQIHWGYFVNFVHFVYRPLLCFWVFLNLFHFFFSAILSLTVSRHKLDECLAGLFYLNELYIALFPRKVENNAFFLMVFSLLLSDKVFIVKVLLAFFYSFCYNYDKETRKDKTVKNTEKAKGSSQTVLCCVTMHAHLPIKFNYL